MSVLPAVLCVGIDNSRCEDVIESIIYHNNNEQSSVHEVHDGHDWKIDTKYYTANAQFRLLKSKSTPSKNILNNVEAIILYVDHSIDSLVKELKEWNSVIQSIDSDVKVMVSKKFLVEDFRSEVEKWCRENEYELIELENDEEQNSECISDEEEILGIERVIEVLQTHEWSNLLLKKNTKSKNSEPVERDENLITATNNVDKKTTENSANSGSNVENLDNMDDLFDLFQNLQSMKLNISSLSEAEKLDKAEKVVKTFWNAIGGDMNEFSDSDDEIT